MDKKLYKFGMDWLNGVLPYENVGLFFNTLSSFSSKLRFDRWNPCSTGMYNYNTRWQLDGQAFFQIAWNISDVETPFLCDMNHNNSGIFISISGDGIRYLSSIGGEQTALCKLLFFLYKNGFKATRFDTYCDILDKDNVIIPHIQEAFEYVGREQVGKPCISTRLRRTGTSYNQNFKKFTLRDENNDEFTNIQIGNHGSTLGMCRVYNKLVEVMEKRLSDFSERIFEQYEVDGYWYRMEYEMHKENAAQCFNALMERCTENNIVLSFEDIFFSAFNRLFKVSCIPTINYKIADCPSEIWQNFAGEVLDNTIHLVQFKPVPYVRVSVARIRKFMERNAAFLCAIEHVKRTLSDKELLYQQKLERDKFNERVKYNELRDEIHNIEFNNNVRFLVQDFNDIYEQTNCFAIIG